MSGALDGILVVSIEQALAAPFCSSRLADAGARVLKVERPEGDFARGYDRIVHGECSTFVWLNRGKESLVLDIKDDGDAALLHRIIDRADVFIQNLAPGAAERAGFGAAELRGRNPRLITCGISGYGEEGSYAEMKAYDLLVQAESGLCSITGTPDGPGRVGVSICDLACGMYAHAAILEGLLERAKTGTGKSIAVSLFDGIAEWMTPALLFYEHTGRAPARVGLSHALVYPYGAYGTKGGEQILIAVQNEREFVRLCADVLGRPDLPKDPRFSDNTARCGHRSELDEIIAAAFGALDRGELVARLRQAQIAYGEVNDVAGLSRHPSLRRADVETPSGPARLVAPPARTGRKTPRFRPVPALGSHTEAIRKEFST